MNYNYSYDDVSDEARIDKNLQENQVLGEGLKLFTRRIHLLGCLIKKVNQLCSETV